MVTPARGLPSTVVSRPPTSRSLPAEAFGTGSGSRFVRVPNTRPGHAHESTAAYSLFPSNEAVYVYVPRLVGVSYIGPNQPTLAVWSTANVTVVPNSSVRVIVICSWVIGSRVVA